ncbi:MAG: class C sortase [Eubacteriales bacterium]|nr:class C sortase [Eubacteriales bacterium]
MKKQKNKKKKSGRWINLLLVVLFLAGWGVLLYPTFSDLWNTYRNSKLINHYQQTLEKTTDEKAQQMLAAAGEYNRLHTTNTILDAFDENGEEYQLTHPYDELLNLAGDGIMGYLDVPRINLEIPIFHGVGANQLERGCGHLQGTSLPIGGVGSHAVMAAHRGLPSAKLFTDLDQIEVGDEFYLHVLQETLAYRVTKIQTVLPDNAEGLAIDSALDQVTLLTCTPYGVNSHRLLVTGVRVALDEKKVEQEAPSIVKDRRVQLLLIGSAVAIVLIIILVIRNRKRNKREGNG